MKRNISFFSSLFVASILATATANAAVTFQGIYKLTKGGAHQGVLILKKETLANGNRKVTSYVAFTDKRTNIGVYETDSKMNAISMTFTNGEAATITTFQGTLKGDQFVTTKTTAAANNPAVKGSAGTTVRVPGGTKFQWFSPDILKAAKGGLRPAEFMTVAFLVPEPGIQVVDLSVGPDEKIGNNIVMPVYSSPKDGVASWTIWVTNDLEPVRMNMVDLQADLVPTMSEAALTMTYDAKAIDATFGGPVKSQHKAVVVTAAPAAAPAAPVAPAKK